MPPPLSSQAEALFEAAHAAEAAADLSERRVSVSAAGRLGGGGTVGAAAAAAEAEAAALAAEGGVQVRFERMPRRHAATGPNAHSASATPVTAGLDRH